MAKKKLAIIIAFLFVFSMFPGSAWAANVSLNLTANIAAVGDSISASGTADANTWVSIDVWDSAQNLVVFDAVKSDSSGNYTCTFKVPKLTTGNLLTVVAGYGSNVDRKTLTIGSGGGGGQAAVTGVSLNKSSTIIIEGANETLLAKVVPTDACNQAVSWSSDKEAVATVDENGKVSGVAAGTATITVKTQDGDKKATCVVTVTKQETATNGGSIAIATDIPVTITVPQGVNSSITVTQNADLPRVEVNSDKVDMTILPGTQVSGSNTITLPEVLPSSSVNLAAAQQVDLVIKVGSDLGTITFTKPVRLVLKGQGQKSAGFIDNNGNFQAISILASLVGLTSDADVDAANIALSNAGVQQGAVVSGSDLIVWTKHFTKFVAYTPAATSGGGNSGGGGGGGGGSVTTTTKKEEPKEVKESDVKAPNPHVTAFNDIQGHWAQAKIISLQEKGIITGYPDNTFRPDNSITRAEFLTMIIKAFNLTGTDGTTFSDTINHWARDVISIAVHNKIASGYDQNSFGPNDPITREQMAVIIAMVKNLNNNGSGKTFTDSELISAWARSSVDAVTASGLMTGYQDNTFDPKKSATRPEAAVVIYNLIDQPGGA
ncbi:MAG: S-layer homology domain-containing protein [Syntrophomonas sp.]